MPGTGNDILNSIADGLGVERVTMRSLLKGKGRTLCGPGPVPGTPGSLESLMVDLGLVDFEDPFVPPKKKTTPKTAPKKQGIWSRIFRGKNAAPKERQ